MREVVCSVCLFQTELASVAGDPVGSIFDLCASFDLKTSNTVFVFNVTHLG